mmetsp:Transcript_17137/g.44885  ORF Transcript_17137/g.44885 Transcript_17137/m.44885 type:complete len:85 (-) Transcript_17137:624-878(-)
MSKQHILLMMAHISTECGLCCCSCAAQHASSSSVYMQLWASHENFGQRSFAVQAVQQSPWHARVRVVGKAVAYAVWSPQSLEHD